MPKHNTRRGEAVPWDLGLLMTTLTDHWAPSVRLIPIAPRPYITTVSSCSSRVITVSSQASTRHSHEDHNRGWLSYIHWIFFLSRQTLWHDYRHQSSFLPGNQITDTCLWTMADSHDPPEWIADTKSLRQNWFHQITHNSKLYYII
jgi:hypothetical protein